MSKLGKCMRMLFCGFMGSGKSCLLEKIKQESIQSNYLFVDLDIHLINRYSFNSVVEMIASVGIDVFRKKELIELNILLKENSDCLIALGGGCQFWDLPKCLDMEFKTIWLDTPFEICYERAKIQGGRPFITDYDNTLELYNKRLSNYQKADLCLDVIRQKQIKNIWNIVNLF